MKTTNRWQIISCLFLLIGLVFLTFSPTLKNGFVNWDENTYLIENVSIRDFSLTGLARQFDPHVIGIYIPLTLVSYSAEYYFFKLTPLIYHLDNLILHIFNVLLVFGLIYLLTSKWEVSFITAAMFGISPLRVESVAWIMERKDVLYAFFYLGALISYIWFIKNKRFSFYGATIILFLCSLFSKPQAISFPLLMFAVDFYYKRTWTRSLFWEKCPFFLLSIVFLAFTMIGIHHQAIPNQDPRFLIAGGYVLLLYLIKSFVPFHLSCLSPIPRDAYGHFSLEIYTSILIVLATVFFIAKYCLKFKDTIFGLMFYFILMALPIFNMKYAHGLFYEHYTYLPSVGIYFIFTGIYIKWLEGFGSERFKKVVRLMLAVYLLVFVWMSYERCGIWKNSMTLWSDVIRHIPRIGEKEQKWIDPNFALAYNNRGNSYKLEGNLKQALIDYNKAIDIDPHHAGAYYNCGLIFYQQGDMIQAVLNFNKALENDHKYSYAYFARGNANYELGKYNQAIFDYNKTIELNPALKDAYYNRSVCYSKLPKIGDSTLF